MGCDDVLFEEPADLTIPDTLRIPPVERKLVFLQGLLDGLLFSSRLIPSTCQTAGNETICTYQNGGKVRMVGSIHQERGTRDILGEERESVEQVHSIRTIVLEDFIYQASSSERKIPAPLGCRVAVTINGTGSIHGVKEDFLADDETWVPLSSGGVYAGEFTITTQVPKPMEFKVSFPAPGFYFRRDMTPLKVKSDPDNPASEVVNALQIGVIHSGELVLNEQRYSYQDVFVEILQFSDFWERVCERP